MVLKVVNTGEVTALSSYLNKVVPQDKRLVLYQNNRELITDALLVSDFIDADFPGYAPIVLTGQNWVVTPGNPSEAEYPTVRFTCNFNTLPQNIFGYYVMNNVTLELQWVEEFPTVQVITKLGQIVTVTPRLTAKDVTD